MMRLLRLVVAVFIAASAVDAAPGPQMPGADSPGARGSIIRPRASSASAQEWIAFSSGRTGDGDIYAIDPATGETVLVAGTDAPEGTVRYDPARDRLVHHRYESNRAVLVSGGADLFADPNGDVAPAWSPDGAWIVYAEQGETTEGLFLARADGSDPQRLTGGRQIDRYPAWSPDGRRIVFARRLESGWDLFTRTIADGTEERITDDGKYVGHPAWSPDGSRIAFDTFYGEQTEIAILELASSAIDRVTTRPGNDLIPAWSSDGRSIAFGGEIPEESNWDLWFLNVATLETRRLTTDPSSDGGPVFVPASALGR